MHRDWTRRRLLSSIAGATAVGGCTTLLDDDPPKAEEDVPTPGGSFAPTGDWTSPAEPPTEDVSVNVLVEGLEIPWDVSVAPNGDLFVTERVGRVDRFIDGDLEAVLEPDDAIDAEALTPGYEGQPWWVDGGEGGTLGIEVHPDYPDVQYLFVYYTASGADENRVSRFDLSADDPAGSEEVLVDGIPASKIHNGGRLEFGPRGDLWVTTGDGGENDNGGDPASLGGKTLRVTVNGEPSPANPDLGEDADPRVYTYGHRNPQGLVWLPDGTPVVSEHGEAGHDEINRLSAGDDYGWPNSPRGRDKYVDADGVHPPLANSGRGTSWAPSGAVFYTGDAVPSWRNRMLVGCLGGQQVLAVTLTPPGGDPPPAEDGRRFDADWFDDAYTATTHPILRDELGRIRHLEQGLDGELYAITSNRDGRAKGEFPAEHDDVLVRIEA